MSLQPFTTHEPEAKRTTHAMLVPWGLFARHIGLIEALAKVPIPQRTQEHAPQSKLIEFFVAILGGCAYLQDISRGVHPLDQDQAVADAWGQPGWADYSGVSRTMHHCTAETVQAVRQAAERVSRPFIDREVVLAVQENGVVVYDGDLTGRPVSSTSTTYPGAAFGWMDDSVRLGYQAALVSMHSPTYGRMWLSVMPHPGDTVSCHQAEALVRAAEARTGVWPLRRTDLLEKRILEQRIELQHAQRRLSERQAHVQVAQRKMQAASDEWRRSLREVAHWMERDGPPRGVSRPYSHLAKARQKVAVQWRRLRRRGLDVQRARQAVARQSQKVHCIQNELAVLEVRLARLLEENRTNRGPVRAIFRLDGGFGSGENLAFLIEMGYEVYGKAVSDKVTAALRRRVTSSMQWRRVGDNAEMVARSALKLDFCPYPLDVGLERFRTGQQERHATLVHYGSQPVTGDLVHWFDFYNARQTIEMV
jgi:hypothetical protein